MSNKSQNDCSDFDGENRGYDVDNETEEKLIGEPELIRKVIIGGLDNCTTDDSLKSHFEQFGTIVDAVVMLDPITNRSRGFAFITFSHSNMVDKVQAASPHLVDGRIVETRRAVRENGRPEESAVVKKLFVGGLKDDHEDDDLREYFSQFGTVTTVNVVNELDNGKQRRFAFVEFDDYDPVDKVVLLETVTIKGYSLDVTKAIS